MIEKLKENIHILLSINLLMTFVIFLTNEDSSSTQIIMLNDKDSRPNEIQVRESICKMAFSGIKRLKMSDYYLHPDIITEIQDSPSDKYNIQNADGLYYKMESKDICKVIVKLSTGFSAFEAVVSTDGPLLYRVTSIRSKKPNYKEIKEYL